jgi:riboflavin kinase, archaea type
VELAILRGKVISGMGNFSCWIEKLHDHYFAKTGMRLFPGTLNVQLEEPYTLPLKSFVSKHRSMVAVCR